MENIIAFASMTNAMKAKDMLRQNGISARLIRTPAQGLLRLQLVGAQKLYARRGAASNEKHSLQGDICG